MGRLSELVVAIRSAASDAVGRLRTRLPGVLGRSRASTAVESAVEDVGGVDRSPRRGGGGAMTRQSTRRRSSATLENPARFVDPEEGCDPTDAVENRERPLSEPADDERNGTRTELRSGDDGRTRIVDAENPDAYVEGDHTVVLDHMR